MINLYNQNLIKKKQGDFKTYGVRLISNTYMNSDNIDTAVKGITVQGEIVLDGFYNNVEAELMVIGEEIVRILSYTADATNRETKFKVERGVFGSPVTTILRGDFAVSVIDVSMETERISIAQENDIADNPFIVSFGQGYLSLHHKPAHWSKISKIQKYNWEPYKTKIFIFEGNDEQCILVWTGFLKKFIASMTNSTIADRVQISMVDRMGMFWEKDLKKIEIIKDMTIDEALSKIFEMPIEKIYFKNTDKSLYPLISMYIPNTKQYYKEVIESFSSNGIRFFFTPKGHLHVFSEVVDNTNLQASVALDDINNIVDIGLSTDNQLVYNYYDTNYSEQYPLYDLNNGVNYKYKVENVRGVILQKNSLNEYDVQSVTVNDSSIPPKMVNISDPVLLLKDNITGLEFICKLLDVNAGGVVLVPLALFSQRGLLEFGRGQWMESLGFLNERVFTLYYSQETLPICSYLTSPNDNSALVTTESLNIPISPIIVDNDGTTELFNLNKEYNLTFGSGRNLQDLTYTGDFVGINNFIGSWVGGVDLLYCREYEQSLNGLDIFVTTTRSTDRNAVYTLPYYTHNDNSGFNLNVTDITDDKSLRARFENTVKKTIKIDSIDKVSFTPSEIIGSIAVLPKMGLKPNDVLFAYKLLPDHTADEELQFKKFQAGGVEIRVSSMSTEGGTTIHLNNPVFPNIEYGILRMEDLVYLQEFYIRANPIVKTSDRIVYENTASVELYDGRKSFSLSETIFDKDYTKKLLSFVNSGYSGLTRDSTKYILPIQTETDIHLELYDLVTIKDDTATYLDDTILWLIIGKTIKCEPHRVVSYTLLNIYSREIEYIAIDFSETQKYTPVTDGTYEWSGIEDEDTGITETQNSFELTDTRLGFLRGILIETSQFRLKTGTGYPAPRVEASGSDYQAYLDELFSKPYVTKFVVKIGSEFIYCTGMKGSLGGETIYILQIIYRQLAESKREETLENRTAYVYLIAEGSAVDYGTYTSSFYCGNGSNAGFLSFNPIEGLIVKAKRIEMTTGESLATDSFVEGKIRDASNELMVDYDSKFLLTENQIKLVTGRVDQTNKDIEVMQASINLEFDDIRIAIDEIEIDESGLVKKTEVIAAINLNTEGVQIQGKNIQLTGDTSVSGMLGVYNSNGITVWDSSSDAVSNKKTVIQGGQIIFYERSP